MPGVLVSRLKINERLHPRSVSNLFGDNLLRAAKTARKYLVLSMRVLGKQAALKVDLKDDDRGRTPGAYRSSQPSCHNLPTNAVSKVPTAVPSVKQTRGIKMFPNFPQIFSSPIPL